MGAAAAADRPLRRRRRGALGARRAAAAGIRGAAAQLAPAARRALGSWREHAGALVALELATPVASSLLEGEAGLLLLAWRLAPDAALADALHARVRENVRNETNELMWGAPGTMLAARAMHRATGEERWADAWRESADELWLRRDDDGLWTQRLQDGRSVRVLGSAHGAAGNVAALLDGGELLDSERRAAVTRDTAALLARTAVVEDGLANWPYREGGELAGGDGEIRVQWCTGAPGMVVSAGSYLDEELLLAGAELAWRAGPPGPAKGAGICHGTAGNGYALLAAFERTGDELWLERARRFAVHALGQVERGRAARGRGRYSLWTGDPGVALYAADCVDALGAFPVVDPRERGG